MKRILRIAMVLGLVGAVTLIAGCSKEKAPQAKEEPASEKVASILKKKDITEVPTKKDSSGKEEVIDLGKDITEVPTKKEASGKEEVIDLGKDVKLEMVLIPAGKFMMGSKKNPVDPFSNIKVEQPPEDEVPQHEVTLTQPFYMGKYEVTQEQWFEIMGENPSREKGRKLPVTDVSWEDCQDFIKKLNAKTNGDYRLPTESEWEYACRAGTTTEYSFGDKITPKDGNYYGSKIGKPVAVGRYKPNAFGLYDMHGNVWECCEDRYADYPAGAVTNPKGPAKGEGRVVRGGSFDLEAPQVRSSNRTSDTPAGRGNDYGFRLAKTK